MQLNDVLLDGFSRIQQIVHRTLQGLNDEDTAFQPAKDANSIGWLVWHLTRIQDDHLAGVAGGEQIWITDDWHKKFNLPFDTYDTGYGHESDDVAAVRPSAKLLKDYYDAVHANTVVFVSSLESENYEKVVDSSYDPPVTLQVRLMSVIADDLQHAGQAAYVRGLLRSTSK